MADETAAAFPALRLEVVDLVVLDDACDRENDLGAFDVGLSDLEGRAVADRENGRELGILTRFDRELFNLDLVTDLDKHLLAAGFENSVCFHCFLSFSSAFLVVHPRNAGIGSILNILPCRQWGATKLIADRTGSLAGLFREEGDAMRLERGFEDSRVAIWRRIPDELHELSHDFAVAATMVAVLLRDDRRRVAEERQNLDLVLVRNHLAARAVEMRDARTLLRIASQ